MFKLTEAFAADHIPTVATLSRSKAGIYAHWHFLYVAMSLYDIIDRSKQAQVRPAYRLKNLREKHARFSNHVTFLSRCHGIIPTELRITRPVKSAKANRIAHRAGQALVRERIADARCQKHLASIHIADLQSNLSQSLTTKKWT